MNLRLKNQTSLFASPLYKAEKNPNGLAAKGRNIPTLKQQQMGKLSSLVTLIVSALCFSALIGFAHGDNITCNIQGRIYCDPCRFQQETRSSIPLKGVKVILQCKTSEEGNVTYTNTGLTDQNGIYIIPMEGNHENDYCEISTDQTTHTSCTETVATKGDRVTLIMSSNLSSSFSTHFARPLGFMSKEIDPRCVLMVKEYDIFKG